MDTLEYGVGGGLVTLSVTLAGSQPVHSLHDVCGHLLDSLSACDHSATLMKPEQAHFERFYGYFFSEGFASDRRKASRASANQNAAGARAVLYT